MAKMKSARPLVPESVASALGDVAVLRVPQAELKEDKQEAYGDWTWHLRRIRLDDRLTGLVQYQVYRHEWTHMVLADAGVQEVIDARLLEIICDAVANAMVLEARVSTDS